jgi:nitrilase
MTENSFLVAAVQATPVVLDRDATIEKACALIADVGGAGARLALFPEAFVPAYPDWVWAIPPGREDLHRQLYGELLANSVSIPGPAVDALCRAAKRAKVNVAIGVNERNAEASNASLYNTLVYIGDDGSLLGKHRKLVPTGAERLVWAQGDGSTLDVYEMPFAKVGGLICWENYMPLARYAMYAWGTQVYLAPTWDRGGTWLATLQHIAKEGRAYVLGCSIAMRRDDIPEHLGIKDEFYAPDRAWINGGGSAIVSPDGGFLAGPVWEKEEILYAEIEASKLSSPKWMFDVAGHYARPDVFELTVHRDARPLVRSDGIPPEPAARTAKGRPAKKRM